MLRTGVAVVVVVVVVRGAAGVVVVRGVAGVVVVRGVVVAGLFGLPFTKSSISLLCVTVTVPCPCFCCCSCSVYWALAVMAVPKRIMNDATSCFMTLGVLGEKCMRSYRGLRSLCLVPC